MANVYTVAKINAYIKGMFSQDFLLENVSVKGEVSNLKYHPTGHIYFTLKDEKSAISCVMFMSNRNGLKFQLTDGMSVVVKGRVDVYERDGKYQIYAVNITSDGEGTLYERFMKLKEELAELGMFAPEYKKPIPQYIKTLGVVTASSGAALRDIINIAKRRNPYINIILYPATVQGDSAAQSVVDGISALTKYGVDTIIVGRGGGSIEDLWAFNERIVAQAVFDCPIPIISAVGHETDTTIIDFVSDLRAPTPSAAAELAVCDINVMLSNLSKMRSTLTRAIENKLQLKRAYLKTLESAVKLKNPMAMIRSERMYADNLSEKLSTAMKSKLTDKHHKVSILSERLNGLSPLNKLSQGYSYTQSNGKTLTSVKNVKEGDMMTVYVKDGYIEGKVISTKERSY